MIELKGLHKYYNKNKSNQLHVLNSINLTFPSKGFVAIYGKSGSGKTTLLNCLGGMDSFDGGIFIAEGRELKGKEYKKISEYKRKNIGFVFQDYNLIENLSVEENILIALGIAKLNISLDTVNTVLQAVDMAKYNKRKVFTLSGGQKQRIAIARALAINPKVILADEPTGNLDKENSIKVMEILKGISAETLVVLVSHERNLADRFADRIIEIDNAKIVSDKDNTALAIGVDYKDDKIYLEDLTKKIIEDENIKINLFYDKKISSLLELNIIIENEKTIIYGDNDFSTDNNKVYNGARPQKKFEIEKPPQIFVKQKLEKCGEKKQGKYKFNIIRNFLSSKLKKIAAVIIAVSAVFIAISMSFLGNAMEVFPVQFQKSDIRQLSLNIWQSNIEEIENKDIIETVLPYINSLKLNYIQKSVLQANNGNDEKIEFTIKPLPISLLESKDILYGRMPENNFEVVLDKMYVEKIFNETGGFSGRGSIFGIVNSQGFLGGEILFYNGINIKVVGISSTSSPVLYMNNDLLYAISYSQNEQLSERFLTENLTDFIKTIIRFENDNEIFVSKKTFIQSGYLNDGSSKININDMEYNVKGFYEPKNEFADINAYIISSSKLKDSIYEQLSSANFAEIITNNKEAAINYFYEQEIYVNDLYESEKNDYIRENSARMFAQLIFTILISISAVIIYYFVVKADIIERNKETSIKIALGIKRRKIYFTFLINSLLFFLIFALSVYFAVAAIIQTMLSVSPGLFPMMSFSITNFLIGILILLAMPVIIATLPILKYLHKKPVQLLQNN